MANEGSRDTGLHETFCGWISFTFHSSYLIVEEGISGRRRKRRKRSKELRQSCRIGSRVGNTCGKKGEDR